MNNRQRKVLDHIIDQLTEMADEEEEKFYNLPESLQDSEKGSALEEGAEELRRLADEILNVKEGSY